MPPRAPPRGARADRRERNEVVRAEVDVAQPVKCGDRVGDILLGQQREGARSRHLHLLVDLGGPDVERAPKNERKTEDVVDLVGIVAAAGGDDGVVARGEDFFRRDFRHRVGQCENDGPRGHGRHHGACHRARHAEAHEYIGAHEGIGEVSRTRMRQEPRLVRVHVAFRPPVVDDAGAVAHEDILALHAKADVVFGRADGRSASPGKHYLHLADVLADDLERVEQRGAGDDRGAVLVIVEHRDAHGAAQCLLDVEALRRLDILQVDPAHRGLEQLAELDDVVRILGAHLEVEDVDVGELLEEVGLALHDRLAGKGADVAEAEDGGAVGDDGHEVPLGRVLVDVVRVVLDGQAGLGDSRGVGEREVALVVQRLRGDDRNLAGSSARVIVEGVVAFGHGQRRKVVASGVGVEPGRWHT